MINLGNLRCNHIICFRTQLSELDPETDLRVSKVLFTSSGHNLISLHEKYNHQQTLVFLEEHSLSINLTLYLGKWCGNSLIPLRSTVNWSASGYNPVKHLLGKTINYIMVAKEAITRKVTLRKQVVTQSELIITIILGRLWKGSWFSYSSVLMNIKGLTLLQEQHMLHYKLT